VFDEIQSIQQFALRSNRKEFVIFI